MTQDELAAEAVTDPLTGLLNRSHLVAAVEEHMAAAERGDRPLSCLMIDLDHFKSVNDTHGHAAGDAVLCESARRFARTVRRSDVLIRYGGEEFVALLPDTDTIGAVTIAARLRESLDVRRLSRGETEPASPSRSRFARASAWRPGATASCLRR